jgi:two-component system, OmpR family, phosphate regulon response regulator PhoB
MRNISKSNLDRPRLLLVEDEAAFAAMLRYNLEMQGFLVDHVTSGQEALSRSAQFRPHLILLDWTLPGMCGIEVCRRLRSRPETKDTGVIMVTGRAGDQNAVRGLDAGADDYVVKPFSITELLARIWALLRRTRAQPERRWLQLRDIVIDLAAFRVTRNGRNIHLGPTEFRLLRFLMEHPTCTLSREEIIDEIWGAGAAVDPRTVDVHVRRLRDAITQEGEPDVIRTVRTAGYALSIG